MPLIYPEDFRAVADGIEEAIPAAMRECAGIEGDSLEARMARDLTVLEEMMDRYTAWAEDAERNERDEAAYVRQLRSDWMASR